MPTSYNGWPASSNAASIGNDPGFTAAGATFPGGVKRGDVSTIFKALVEFLDAEVEPVHPGWCWGYNYRATTGGTSLSCHASATAIDYNAPEHPYGVRGTWTAEQIRKVDTYLRDVLHGSVRWGEHYSSNVDGMHFEINTDAATVARVAASLGDEDMPFTDWPEKDRKALVDAVADATSKRILGADLTPSNDENDTTVRGALNGIKRLLSKPSK